MDEPHASVEVEIRGLSIYTHHGVTDAEQEVGQRLEFDLTFDVPDCDPVLTDRIDATVDYSQVCDIVALAATERSYRTLERLCHVVADRLMERFDCESVQVRAAKPEPPVPYPVQEAAVEVPWSARSTGSPMTRTASELFGGRGAGRLSRPRLEPRRPRIPPPRGDRRSARPRGRGGGGLLSL